ncbi:deacylase [Halapricum sp. CBA1109]|uniref:succinylglutamate desuccinylase/aspartoacylase family protein n=1 Tax=Halapricum sp. CBA1109 TaxID=2668068 RepID=UPI0012F8D4CF|nr:succinylglutamate desuccinylase/aspartoacylase family protein [Halapricum sp. CBA1109]MUV89250.1 deacylase [Halapricum sp. CBA1109]
MEDAEPFTVGDVTVEPGSARNFRYRVSETYLGEPVRMPVTVVVGKDPGPTVVLTAAAHGDELNGIEVVREVAQELDHDGLAGTLICLPVLNVPGFLAQKRYLPVYDRDLNRAFPGDSDGTGASRMASRIFEPFVSAADLGLDFHTSTRGRTNMLHVRADTTDERVDRLAKAFGTHVVIDSEGSEGTLRRAATAAGTPTVTVEMGEAHRFQRALIDRALDGVRSVFAEFGLLESETVRWPGWRTVIEDSGDRTWLRADTGGLVDMHHDRGTLVYAGEAICTIASPFGNETSQVVAPFDGVLVGVLENPVVYPGNPLVHLVAVDDRTRRAIESRQ